jgi:hypothetical protein
MPQCQFLFSVVFVFQKSYTGNILGIGWNKSRSSYLPERKTESKGEIAERIRSIVNKKIPIDANKKAKI